MIYFNPLLVTGGQVPTLDVTKETVRFNFGNIYFTFFEEKLSHIENMWGEATPLKNYSYLDVSITANVHPIELEILQKKFLNQDKFEFTWNRIIDYKDNIKHTSKEARIAKMEAIQLTEEIINVKIRVIATDIELDYPKLSTKIPAYYQNIDRCLRSSKYEFVLRTYRVCIALHKKTNITDIELAAVRAQFIDLGLFKDIDYVLDDNKLTMTLDGHKFHTKY